MLREVPADVPECAPELRGLSRKTEAGPASRSLAQATRLWDTFHEARMRSSILLVVLLALVVAPLAMAIDDCPGMGGAVCAVSCSVPCAATPTPVAGPVLAAVASVMPIALARVQVPALRAPDAPPRSLLSA